MFVPLGPNARAVVEDLLARFAHLFGGATAFTRSPAQGLWKNDEGRSQADDVVIVEAMAREMDPAFWRALQGELQERLAQDEVLIRASPTVLITPIRNANGRAQASARA